MRSVRFVLTLLLSGLVFLVAGIALSIVPANAASERDGGSPYRYTDHPQRASTGRVMPVYIDSDFDAAQRERILLAIKQWNHVLNGFVQLRAQPLPRNASPSLQQAARSGAWIVARVDSRHPVARRPEAQQALALTVGGSGGGYIYVIGDRFGLRDMTGVMMHEIGHALGAGHDESGHLMAPVYNPANGCCIDRGSVAMVAQAQRLPLNQLNWCVGPGLDQREARSRYR